ncbi:YigZ family protein [uncultured Deefgea sp.]|uniref:IMPACT family protein n=1 Tax=uncultured Deefgea sp. TaxID=1304914 RepID=UPI002637353A|nr:YigZ family protein [uncultured Deefgea sp.]
MSTTLANAVDAEIIIKKSRFIGYVIPVDHRAHALTLVADFKQQHPEARHVCWALLAGGESGMSDDGEPSGTAARPMMQVLQHKHLDGVLAVVIRYFGGVKLGAGGLTRAYTEAIARPLLAAEYIETVPMDVLQVALPFAEENKVRHYLQQHSIDIGSSDFTNTEVILSLTLPRHLRETTLNQLHQLCRGQTRLLESDN